MKKPKQQVSQSRRKFIRDAGVTGGIAAVAVSTPRAALAETQGGHAEQDTREGYRLTQHILAYYKTAAS